MTVRSVRANNPGNIRQGAPWKGLMAPEAMSPEQKAETAFCVFQSPVYGFRAMGIILLNYELLHGLKTIEGYIDRWAPPNENNTGAYVAHVADFCHVAPTARFDLRKPDYLAQILKAIAIHEAGSWLFTDADLVSGVQMALADTK